MRKLALSFFLLFTSISFAGEHAIKWKISGHEFNAEFETKIAISSNQQTITHHFPQGFSFTQIMTGTQNTHHDTMFIHTATPSTTITTISVSDSTVLIENNGVRVQTQSLLALMHSALQSSADSTTPVSGSVSLGVSPIPLLPGSNEYLDQVTSNGIVVNGNVAYTNLYASYGAGYGVILEQTENGFNLVLTHSAIEEQNIQEVLADVHDEGIGGDGDGLHEEASFSVFIPTLTMHAMTGFQSTDSQPDLAAATTTSAALLLTAAALQSPR